jgi:Dual-action HEIGH metallo-peptidase
MRGCQALILLLAILGTSAESWAVITVNAPLPITHRVTVQMIQTAKDDGSMPATLFGNPAEENNIKSLVDQIWSQAGIDIDFLPTVTLWDNTFAYQGNSGSNPRPASDLGSIISLADSAGVLNTQPEVINLFFVEVAPFFAPLPENTVAGYANIGFVDIAVTVGNTLPTFQNGRDVVAHIVSHEIGHNLGLKHNGVTNLMTSSVSTEQLTAAQIGAVLQTTFRDDSVAYIPNGGTGIPQLIATVPEPATIVYLTFAALCFGLHRRRLIR